MHGLYEYGDVFGFWNSGKCRHARKCREDSPRTFNPTRRPWIDLTKTLPAEVWQAVSNCPTGALTCVYSNDISIILDEESSQTMAYDGDQQVGECDYHKTTNGWEIYHTEVLSEYLHKGIAKRLVYWIVEAAERAGAGVIPSCLYAFKVLE